MRILLITMGGKIDCCLNEQMRSGQPYIRSHAYPKMKQLCRTRTRKVEPTLLDFLPLGRKGAKRTTPSSCASLHRAIFEKHASYDRIVVTLPARESFWLSRDLASKILIPRCAIVFTGAEAPDPINFTKNRLANLICASFKHPNLAAGIYISEGEFFKAALPQRAEYLCRRAARPQSSLRPHHRPLVSLSAG